MPMNRLQLKYRQMQAKYEAESECLKRELAARDLVIKQMREAEKIRLKAKGITVYSGSPADVPTEAIDEFVQRAVLEEREACAALCESLFDADDDTCREAETCAAAIRGRGK